MGMTISRVNPALGARVIGLDSRQLIDDATVDRLHGALLDHQVLFIDGAGLDAADLVALAQGFGSLAAPHHCYPTDPDHPDVAVLTWDGDHPPDAAEWHADMTYRPDSPFATLLQAVELPPLGGDTLWASMYSVHDALDAGLRADLAHLEAIHELGVERGRAYLNGGLAGLADATQRAGAAVQPVIAHHPTTGRPYLNVSESFTRFVVGFSAAESARLLTMLFDLVNRPDHHVRLSWRPGTIAMWDNRGTQHYAVADYVPHRRVMQRVVVATDDRQPAPDRAPSATSVATPVSP